MFQMIEFAWKAIPQKPDTYRSEASGCARIVDTDEGLAWKALSSKI
jgi:hypothetical protein